MLAAVREVAILLLDLETDLVELLALLLPDRLHCLVRVQLQRTDLLPHVLQILHREVLEARLLPELSVDFSELLLVGPSHLLQLLPEADGVSPQRPDLLVLPVEDSDELLDVDLLEHLVLGHLVL